MNARRLAKNAVALEECRTSFGAWLREAPQDEAFLLMPSTAYPYAEEQTGAAGVRLEARTTANAAHSCQAPVRSTHPTIAITVDANFATFSDYCGSQSYSKEKLTPVFFL